MSLSSELKVLESALMDAEAWQNRTAGLEKDAELSALHTLRDNCQVSGVTRGQCQACDLPSMYFSLLLIKVMMTDQTENETC